jgi:hypothetical protein
MQHVEQGKFRDLDVTNDSDCTYIKAILSQNGHKKSLHYDAKTLHS